MGRREVETVAFGPIWVTAEQKRRAVLHIADRIGAEHPTAHDDTDPHLAGRLVAHDPHAREELLLLLDAIGYRKEQL